MINDSSIMIALGESDNIIKFEGDKILNQIKV